MLTLDDRVETGRCFLLQLPHALSQVHDVRSTWRPQLPVLSKRLLLFASFRSYRHAWTFGGSFAALTEADF